MRMIRLAFFLMAICALFTGCNNEKIEPHAGGDEIVEHAEVINSHGSIKGLEKMDQFYQDTTKKAASKIRVVHYTIEGDPIITDLSYDGEILTVQHDTTRDQFGNGSIDTFTCNQFYKEENPTNLSYVASECTGKELGMDEILFVEYDMKQQDLFEIQLKYGKDLENDINTIDKELIKVVSKDETRHTADFDLSSSIKQEIYKRLVLTNYLQEDSLKNHCGEPNRMKYDLKVKINGASRKFVWDACADSIEAKKMTDIAEFIILSSEKSQDPNTEEAVQGYILEVKENELLVAQDMTAFFYQLIKDTSINELIEGYNIRLVNLEGVSSGEFKKGDKISAVITGEINEESKPGSAIAKEIKKIN